jgi:hypothetical protein
MAERTGSSLGGLARPDEPGFLTIKPTSDKVLRPGAVSTVSDESNNIHWFTALTGPVFMFNTQVMTNLKDERARGSACRA